MEETKHAPVEKTPEEDAQKHVRWWRKRRVKWIAVVVFVAVLLLLLIAKLTGSKNHYDSSPAQFTKDQSGQVTISESEAIKEGKALSNNQCEGEGVPYKLSASPMKPEDFSIIVPYGLMVGGHVTPIDHQYFSPKDYKSKPDAYEVLAMADATIVDITTRPRPFGQEYRMVFTISCTFFYYYDLVTSLSTDIQKTYDDTTSDKANKKTINIPVKAGQVIGRIGGQTLDFAVWDTTKPLQGFIVPEHYQAERWKIFTADPLDYYTDELKSFILSRYVRTAPPISGKIDYDIDGRLIGNWFLEGTNGYEGDRQAANGAYWRTHLSFSPNLYAPDWFEVSIGDFETFKSGEGSQFVTSTNMPNPKDVSVDSGLVKYQLHDFSYTKDNGASWDQNSLAKNIGIKPNTQGNSHNCALVQMLETRKIKFEAFKGKSCASVSAFSANAKIYTR